MDAQIVDDVINEIPATPKARSRSTRTRITSKASTSQTDGDGTFREAKSGPPSLDEWTKFFSKIVLRAGCDWYLSIAFRGIDEEALSDREIERLAMTDEERKMIAVPFAELSNKSRFMRKHGRMIVSSGDAVNALIVMGAWITRVNRIASKHRPRVVKPNQQQRGGNVNGSSGQGTPQANGNGAVYGTGNGRVYPFAGGIVPGSS